MTERTEIAKRFIQAIPHCQALGMQVVHMGEGEATYEMPYAEHLVGDPRTGVIAGGAVSALMDSCCGGAVMSHPVGPSGTATIDLRIDYMRAATPGQTLVTTATCYHVTRSVAFVRATTADDDTENPVAAATGVFTLEGLK